MSHVVRYRVPETHLTKTVRGEAVLEGSIHHAETAEFTGLVTRSHADGSHDIVIFPPDRAMVHVHGVQPGDGPGTLTLVTPEHPAAGGASRARH